MATISYQPWYVGQTYPAWDIPLNIDSGPDDISVFNISQFSLIFRTASGTDTTGTGTFSLKNSNPAEVFYQPSDTDVSATFTGTLIVKAQTPTGKKAVYDAIPFTISAD